SLDERVADLSWLGTRAVAHDRVQTWGSDAGPLVPLPMFTLFSDRASVRRMLDARADALTGALSHAALGREYGLRVFRIDAELTRVVDQLRERQSVIDGEVLTETWAT